MPVARYQLPDGRIGRFEVPEGTTPEQAQAMIESSLSQRQAPIDVEAAGDEARRQHWQGLSSFDAGVAGAGKGAVDLFRGAGQLLRHAMPDSAADRIGLPSQASIDATQRNESGLMDRTAGKVGAAVGAGMTAVPAAFVPGANTVLGSALAGAGIGALQPTASNESALMQAGVGGLGGAAGQAIGRAIPVALKGMVSPLFRQGQEGVVSETLSRASGMAPDKLAAALRQGNKQLVPGSIPTAAEAAANPGLASLELAAAAEPAVKNVVRGQQMSNMGARLGVLNDMAKTEPWREQMRGVRGLMSEQLYKQAMDSGIDPGAARALAPQIKSLIERLPAGSLEKARDLARQAGISIDDPAGSVKGLQYLKWVIGDRLKGVGQGALQGEERRVTTQTLADLNTILEKLNPQFQQANKAFASWSKPINAAETAQALKDKLVPSLMDFAETGNVPTRVRAQSFADALRNAPATIQKATGQRGRELTDVMGNVDAGRVSAVAQDLARRASTEDMAKTVGSTTAQNLAARSAMRRVAGPLGMPETWGEGTAALSTFGRPLSWGYGKFVEPGVQDTLARALADPAFAASILSRAPSKATKDVIQLYGDLLTAGSIAGPSGYLAQ